MVDLLNYPDTTSNNRKQDIIQHDPYKISLKILASNGDGLFSGKAKAPEIGFLDDEECIITDPSKFRHPELLTVEELYYITGTVRPLLAKEPTCVNVSSPITVVGDLHGQLFDLFELLAISGVPPESKFLFLGDYVDRGFYSIETVCLLFLFKIMYQNRVTMLRGNHETWQISTVYGFYDEIMRKYGDPLIWREMVSTFDYLPITATIDNDVFLDHGGLSPHLETIDDINATNRFRDLPQNDPLSDLVWSDPDNCAGFKQSVRGAGYNWGLDITDTFLYRNGLKWICRAHQVQNDGFSLTHDDKVVTVFSAPNYCYRCNNKAAVCEVQDRNTNQPPMFLKFVSAPKRGVEHRPPDKSRISKYF